MPKLIPAIAIFITAMLTMYAAFSPVNKIQSEYTITHKWTQMEPSNRGTEEYFYYRVTSICGETKIINMKAWSWQDHEVGDSIILTETGRSALCHKQTFTDVAGDYAFKSWIITLLLCLAYLLLGLKWDTDS